ncbi:MAG: polysaccharide biosynthesis protein [Lentisphaerae bacterium]|nr:polysaccharide biosynthesis protein [Lentisphaerota bacterium]
MADASTARPGLRGIAKRFGVLAAAHGFRELLQAVFLIVLARRQMAAYGDFVLAFGLGQILLLFAEFGLNQHAVCRLARTPDAEAGIVRGILAAKSLLLALGGCVAFAFVLLQSYDLPLRSVVLLLAAGVGLEALTSTYFTLGQWHGRQRGEAVIRGIAAAAGFGYGLAALAAGWPPVLLALFKPVESVVALAGAAWLLRPARGDAAAADVPLVATLGGGLVFALIELAAIVYNKANLFFLRRAAGAEAVAQYGATWQIVDGVTSFVCGLLLARSLFPALARLLATDRAAARALVQDTARWLLVPAAVLVYGLAVESDRLLPLLYGGAYGEAVWMQRWLAASVAIGFAHNLAAYVMMGLGRERRLLVVCAAGLALNLVLCAAWIPRQPLAGSVGALLLTKAAVAAGTVGFAQRHLGLLRARDAAEFLAALLAGAAVFLLLRTTGPRLLHEAAALVPLAALVVLWRRARPAAAEARA